MSNKNLLKLLRNGSCGLPSPPRHDIKSARGDRAIGALPGGKLAPSFSHLSLAIDCQSTQSAMVDYSASASCIDIECSAKEKRITALLDQLGVHQVNFQDFIKDQRKTGSPEIQRLFDERNKKMDAVSVSPNSNLTLGKQPSLLRRRMMQSQASIDGRSETFLKAPQIRPQNRGLADQFSLKLKSSFNSEIDNPHDFKTPVKRKSKFDEVVSDHQTRSRSAMIVDRRDTQTKMSKFCGQGQVDGGHSDCSESSNEFDGGLQKKEGYNNIKRTPLRKHTSPVFAFSILERHQDEEQQMSNLSESIEAEETFYGKPESSPSYKATQAVFKATPETSGCDGPTSFKTEHKNKNRQTLKVKLPQRRSGEPGLSESPTEPNFDSGEEKDSL